MPKTTFITHLFPYFIIIKNKCFQNGNKYCFPSRRKQLSDSYACLCKTRTSCYYGTIFLSVWARGRALVPMSHHRSEICKRRLPWPFKRSFFNSTLDLQTHLVTVSSATGTWRLEPEACIKEEKKPKFFSYFCPFPCLYWHNIAMFHISSLEPTVDCECWNQYHLGGGLAAQREEVSKKDRKILLKKSKLFT